MQRYGRYWSDDDEEPMGDRGYGERGREGRERRYGERGGWLGGGRDEWRGGMRDMRDWRDTEPYYGRRDEPWGPYGRRWEEERGRYGGMRRGWREHDAQRDYGAMYGRPLEGYRRREGMRWEDRERGRWSDDEPSLMDRIGEGIRRFFAGNGGRGPHAGRGPKGYRRSDDRVREDVCDRIATWGWVDASDVEVRVQEGEVTLSGQVGARRDKRLLEEMIEDISGVVDVHNQVRVRREQGPRAPNEAMRTGPGPRA